MTYTTVAENLGWDSCVTRVACGPGLAAHLIATPRYLVVLDTLGHPAAGRELREHALERLGGRQLLVVTTHADWDHYFGNQAFDCPILGTRGCVARVAVDGPVELARKAAEDAALWGDVTLTPPNLAFEGEFVIDDFVRLFPTPGHRSDHVAAWIPSLSLLLPGDLLEAPVPITDDEPAALADYEHSLETLLELKPTWVLANHAAPCPGPELIGDNLGYLRELRAAAYLVRAGQAASMEEAFPFRWEGAADFYRDEHARACASALAAE